MRSLILFAWALSFILSGCKFHKNTRTEVNENGRIVIHKTLNGGDQSVVEGQVRDSKEGDFIPELKVLLTDEKGFTFGSFTDSEGHFSITRIPSGNYQLSITGVGYTRFESPFQVDQMTRYTLDVEIMPPVIQVEKPVIYLYPLQKQQIEVKLDYAGEFTHTYPKYPSKGWHVLADRNGTLWDNEGKEYYALFWEGRPYQKIAPKDGFIVPGKETAVFLEEKLAYLGLNRREANEFIMYWLPRLESNPYNLVHFSGREYEELARLEVIPKPETFIRVMMLTQGLRNKISFPEQDLIPLKKTRKGYTLVEWGGMVVDCIKEDI